MACKVKEYVKQMVILHVEWCDIYYVCCNQCSLAAKTLCYAEQKCHVCNI